MKAQRKRITGFLLTQAWHDRSGHCEVVLTGCSDAGPFELILRERPLFFVKQGLELPRDLHFDERRELTLCDFDDNRVDALYFRTNEAMRAARKRVREIGAYTYEGDLNPADRFLMERFIYGGVTIDGPCRADAVRQSGGASCCRSS